jgi:hypothetical protein
MSAALTSMLELIGNIFGNDIWKNVILEVTHWSYDERSIERRNKAKLTETWWTDEFNSYFSKAFGLRHRLPSVFIDSFYNKTNPMEQEEFDENIKKLMEIVRSGFLIEQLCI